MVVLQSAIRLRAVVLTVGAAIALSSPLGAASVVPRQTTPVYIAKFTVAADTPTIYSGVTTFNVDKEGKVTGKMALDNPVGVDAALNGTLKADVWTFEYTYSIPQQGCEGIVSGTSSQGVEGSQAHRRRSEDQRRVHADSRSTRPSRSRRRKRRSCPGSAWRSGAPAHRLTTAPRAPF
jgi:hypothetical protein